MPSASERPSAIVEEILDIVARESMTDRSSLTPDTMLVDLDIQSADYVMILMAIEERFGTYISVDEELTEAKTVRDLCDLVVGRIEASSVGDAV